MGRHFCTPSHRDELVASERHKRAGGIGGDRVSASCCRVCDSTKALCDMKVRGGRKKVMWV